MTAKKRSFLFIDKNFVLVSQTRVFSENNIIQNSKDLGSYSFKIMKAIDYDYSVSRKVFVNT